MATREPSRFRQWINRDDGRFCRVGNRPLGGLEIAGTLLWIAALALWQLHDKVGIDKFWAIAAGIFGLILFAIGDMRSKDD